MSALGLATFYVGLATERLLSREQIDRARIFQGGFEPDLVLGPDVAEHGWGLGYMLNQRRVNGPNLAFSATAAWAALSGSSTSSTGSATPT